MVEALHFNPAKKSAITKSAGSTLKKNMPGKHNQVCKTAEIILTLLIAFNLVFQGLAFSVHLHSHHHEHHFFDTPLSCNIHIPHTCHDHTHHKDDFSMEKRSPFKTGTHEECLICKILNTLHHPFAFNNLKLVSFTPFHFEESNCEFDNFNNECRQIYNPRAPPLIYYHTV